MLKISMRIGFHARTVVRQARPLHVQDLCHPLMMCSHSRSANADTANQNLTCICDRAIKRSHIRKLEWKGADSRRPAPHLESSTTCMSFIDDDKFALTANWDLANRPACLRLSRLRACDAWILALHALTRSRKINIVCEPKKTQKLSQNESKGK